jgi:hypothetical protein
MLSRFASDFMSAVAIKYELLSLEEFVREELPKELTELSITAVKVEEWQAFVNSECKRIRKAITSQVLSIAKSRHVELYIQHHQAAIIYLSDVISGIKPEKGKSLYREFKGLLYYINRRLLKLLSFLEHYFEGFFDHSQAIPLAMRYEVAKEFRKIMEQFNDSGLFIQSDRLFSIVLEPLESIAANRFRGITFHELSYYRKLSEEILLLTNDDQFNCRLAELLCQMNYNSESFRNYLVWHLTQQLQDHEEKEEQLKFIAERLKALKQLSPLSDQLLHPNKTGITDYFINWLTEELQYIRSSDTWQEKDHNNEATTDPQTLHGTTLLTVNQLGIFLHLLQRSKILHHKNQTSLIQLFAQHFKTKDREPISAKSLRNSYYDYDPKTVTEVRDLLYELIKHLKNME